MKILFVASYNKGYYAPFIVEQADALRALGCEVEFFGVVGKGPAGYAKNLKKLKAVIKEFGPDVVHAHYGLCGLLACLQHRVPVVTTFHGSDINEKSVLPFSRMAMRRSAHNVFVSRDNMALSVRKKKSSLVPCGVNPDDYPVVSKARAREEMGLSPDGKYVLFAGAFDNKVKNHPLAEEAVKACEENVELLELKGYTRHQVALLMSAADALLMTSFTEGSPQVIKEAMMCGLPIVSVNVGDVSERITGLEGCFIAAREPKALAAALSGALTFGGRTAGRERIKSLGLFSDRIASHLLEIYNRVKRNN